ncbi:hypothetical protein FF38_05005 [Lucilia cuprina]|uniref:Uncharacterized protein n=1 Tax=Lucilia cuprina TaxID=7375 RepID=A0A0L0CJ60_LUCCU|nr:hypothetical protein CVS40_0684 [Lucilia cuprina]KNC32418.1 hypothetical protein FF38_05005 [Lucilia cuprina]
MRSLIFALFLAICCIVIYTNAAALPENSDVANGDDQSNDVLLFDENQEDDEASFAYDNEEVGGNAGQDPQSRTLFLLLPLLFPDQFYFS